MCDQGLHSQCETTQVRDQGMGAALFGYTKLYGEVPGGQAEFLRVPFGNTLPVKVPDGPPDDRFVFLSDVLPTAWQAVEYADVPDGGSLVVLGLGPIGDMCCRVAHHRGHRVIGVDLVPERLARVAGRGIEVLDLTGREDDLADDDPRHDRRPRPRRRHRRRRHGGARRAGRQVHADDDRLPARRARGEADGARRRRPALGPLPRDRHRPPRRHDLASIGVYGGQTDPLPMLTLFDKQIQLRMGQANVRRWVPEIMPLLLDGDPLGVDDFATHRLPLDQGPDAYAKFQKKEDGYVKVLLQP